MLDRKTIYIMANNFFYFRLLKATKKLK